MMAARLQGDVGGGAACGCPGGIDRDDLGMRLAGATVKALANNLAVAHEHAADPWVWVGGV